MIFTTAKTKERFQKEIDPFGDTYIEDATPETLSEVLLNENENLLLTPGIQTNTKAAQQRFRSTSRRYGGGSCSS